MTKISEPRQDAHQQLGGAARLAAAGAACIMLINIGGLDIEVLTFVDLVRIEDVMVGATGFEPATSTPPV